MDKVCENCGKRFEAPTTGRPKRFCHGRCRVMAHRKARSAQVPASLVGLDRWVGWKPIRRGDRWTKMPVQVDGRPASSTNPDTWASFQAVKARGDRVGFVLGADVDGKRVVCVDLDHCLDASGVLSFGAEDLLAGFPATWVEVSPSGDGLHVWGLLDRKPSRSVFEYMGQSVEVYADGRYLTVTGDRFRGAPLVLADLSEVLSLVV